MAEGLGWGGEIGKFRLFIDEDLTKGYSSIRCNTFDDGQIAPLEFRVSVVEAWGLGDQSTLEQQAAARTRDRNVAENMRKVNRALLADGGWEASPDKWLLDLAGKTGVSDVFLDRNRQRPDDEEHTLNKN